MHKRSESFFSGYDKTKLFLQKWTSIEAKLTVLITHGQGEHSDSYNRLIHGLDLLFPSRFNFIGWDLRGHGKSQGIRGYAKDFDEYVLDFQCFLESVQKQPELQKKPVVLLSHSMGGIVQACDLSEKVHLKDLIKAQILSAPLFGVAVNVPEWKDRGANVINKLLPKLTLGNEIKNSQLTRDLDVIREFEQLR